MTTYLHDHFTYVGKEMLSYAFNKQKPKCSLTSERRASSKLVRPPKSTNKRGVVHGRMDPL